MITGYPNRASWKPDDELEMLSILRTMPLDDLRAAQRLIRREVNRREQAGPEQHVISDAEKALFRHA